MIQSLNRERWVRSSKGWLAGVCQGLGERLGIEPRILRVLWFISFIFFGFGFLLYIGMAWGLPKERQTYTNPNKILGVCYKMSLSTGLEVGFLRFIALLLLIVSGIFPALIGYLLLHTTREK